MDDTTELNLLWNGSQTFVISVDVGDASGQIFGGNNELLSFRSVKLNYNSVVWTTR